MKNHSLAGLVAAVVSLWPITGSARVEAPRQDDVLAFCAAHKTVDYPDPLFFGQGYKPGAIPPQISRLEDPLKWRCMNGRVLVCSDSADGDWCSRKDASREASSLIQQACRDEPNRAEFNFAEAHYSAFDWRCRGGKPVIVRTYPLDQRGFFKASWTPVIVRRGVVIGPKDFPAGSR